MTLAVIANVETMLEKWKGQEGKKIEVFHEFRLLISRTAFGNSYLEGEKIFAMLNKLSIIISRNIFKTRIPFIRITCNAYHNLDEKNRLSLEDLVDECKTFYVTGQETVNSLIA
ncbi:hypothetical protein V6N11_065569 [Hibiscus sabdariffa]|uniref:Uncharacterized protein n=1 Tax=Hibiscus sabdariffa TaxID=183260 RepID=A0ABR2PHN8_9ROSI